MFMYNLQFKDLQLNYFTTNMIMPFKFNIKTI